MAITKLKLSGSTDGKGIKVAATATAGTTLHTAHATNLDEVYVYLVNTSAAPVKATIEWGETTAPDGNIEQTIAPEDGLVLVIPGLLLTNSLVVRCFASVADVLVAHGYVHRIS